MVVVLMDVEKLKKINEMSKEFKKFGFSDDSLGAIKDAGKIYADKDEHDILNSNPEKIETTSESQEIKPEIFKEFSSDYDQSSIDSREIELLKKKLNAVEQFKLEQSEKMQKFYEQIEEMKKEFIALHGKINELTNIFKEGRITEKQDNSFIREESHEEEKKDNNKNSGQYNERIGNFKSEDVSIEKMFYYGNK